MLISIYVTHPNKTSAERMVQMLLEEKLIACGNVFPIQSMYWWNGEIENEGEFVSLMKSIPDHWDEIKDRTETIHDYDIPCVIKYEIESNEAYEKWVRKEVK